VSNPSKSLCPSALKDDRLAVEERAFSRQAANGLGDPGLLTSSVAA
jgi:hypothetical protein